MSQINEGSGVNGGHTRRLPNDEIDLRELLDALWRRKYALAAASVVCGLLAFASSYLFERKYEAALLFVAQNDDGVGDRGGGLGALASQLGGLAALGGISMPGSGRKAEYLAILQSQVLLERFITKNNLMPVLYADAWDRTRSAWKVADPKEQPTTWKAVRHFKSKVMRLTTDNKTGLSTLSMTASDANTAALWANGLLEMANDYVRTRTIAEAERNLVYLNGQLGKTSVVALQNSISSLLENQIKRIMLAQGTDQYAFRVIDPAVPPGTKSFPKRIMWGILGFVIGMIVSLAFVLFERFGPSHGTKSTARY